MNNKETTIFAIICIAIGFCLGYMAFQKPINQAPLGGSTNWESVENQTWDSLN